jgi:translation initiation factor 2-alpha kinase 4
MTSAVSRQELVGWLQHQIAEQKRLDIPTAGAPSILAEVAPDVIPSVKDTTALSDVQLLLPDSKKRGKQVKQIFAEKGVWAARTQKAKSDLRWPNQHLKKPNL